MEPDGAGVELGDPLGFDAVPEDSEGPDDPDEVAGDADELVEPVDPDPLCDPPGVPAGSPPPFEAPLELPTAPVFELSVDPLELPGPEVPVATGPVPATKVGEAPASPEETVEAPEETVAPVVVVGFTTLLAPATLEALM